MLMTHMKVVQKRDVVVECKAIAIAAAVARLGYRNRQAVEVEEAERMVHMTKRRLDIDFRKRLVDCKRKQC